MNKVKFIALALVTLTILALSTGSALAALDDYFVSTSWLADNRDDVVIVDVRKSPLYYLGHIEGAHLVERDKFLSKRNEVKSLVPTVAEISSLLGSLGISADTKVVAYAEDDNPYAARFVWTLRFHGHENAFVLDGGYNKWSKEGQPTSLLPTKAPQAVVYQVNQRPASASLNVRADGDYVLTRVANPSVIIWDTRRPAEYVGTEVRADRGGHIPGATNLNWVELQEEVNGVKVLKSETEIRELLASHGITSEKEIIAHCQTGIRSSYATLVLLGLGYGEAKNYDGSWIEWANNPSLPIEQIHAENDEAVKVSLKK